MPWSRRATGGGCYLATGFDKTSSLPAGPQKKMVKTAYFRLHFVISVTDVGCKILYGAFGHHLCALPESIHSLRNENFSVGSTFCEHL
jgi:hypothetical protein